MTQPAAVPDGYTKATFYIVGDDGKPKSVGSHAAWEAWLFADPANYLRLYDHDTHTSTTFLPAHGWFETMILEGRHDGRTWTWKTRSEAEAGHAAVVAALRTGGDLPEVTG